LEIPIFSQRNLKILRFVDKPEFFDVEVMEGGRALSGIRQ